MWRVTPTLVLSGTRPGVLALALVATLAGGTGAPSLSAEIGAGVQQRPPASDARAAAGPRARRDEASEVRFTARVVDGKGRPATASIEYPIEGLLDGMPWDSTFRRVPGSEDTLTVSVPRGLRKIRVDPMGDNIWWTWAPGAPRVNYAHIELKAVDGDRPEIVVQRLKSASLEIRVRTRAGELPENAVHVYYPRRGGGDGGPVPTPRIPGIYRLEAGLLPGRPTEVWIRAPGFKTKRTQPFQFTEEGQRGYIELTAEPGQGVDFVRNGDEVPAILKGIDGKPIPQPVVSEGPFRSIACRAVDKGTGAAVADAAVTFGVEQRIDEDGEEAFDSLFQRETRTDRDGRFTVLVPEKYLPDPAPKRKLDVRVTIRHPRYVDFWDTADAREIAQKGVSETFPLFHAPRLTPARTLTGRLLNAEGRPLPKVQVYKQYQYDYSKPETWIRDADFPLTDADGRFRTKVPAGVALKLEFRTGGSARTYYPVLADRADLGDIRVSRGVRVSGRVLDGDGKPVRWISVTAPPVPDPTAQPNFVYKTGQDGSFQTDELAPGSYEVRVGDIYRTEDGKDSPIAVKEAPGVYIPVPLTIRAGQDVPELAIRPVEHVRFVATLVSTRPGPERTSEGQTRKTQQDAFAEWFQAVPVFSVEGRYNGTFWGSQGSLLAMEEKGRYSVRVPRGLTGATLRFGPFVQRFRIDQKSPELFGPGYRLGAVESDRADIRIRRYAETTLHVRCVGDGDHPVAGVKLEARYVREPEMRAAGAVFDPPMPQAVAGGDGFRILILPDEEVELSASAGGQAGTARVKQAEGKTGEVIIRLSRKS